MIDANILGLGAILGGAGQVVRMIIGLKKVYDQADRQMPEAKNLFTANRLGTSILIGAAAGIVAVLALDADSASFSRELAFGIMGAGYSGADFLEGVFRREGTNLENRIAQVGSLKLPLDKREEVANADIKLLPNKS